MFALTRGREDGERREGGNKRQYRVSGKEKGSNRLNDAWFPGYLGSLWGTYSCCLGLTIWEAPGGNKKDTEQGRGGLKYLSVLQTDRSSLHIFTNHHICTIPWNLTFRPRKLHPGAQDELLHARLVNPKFKNNTKEKNIIQVIQIIRNVQSNGIHHTLSSLQYISRIGRNCWKEQMWTHARFLQVTMPNCQLRWPNFIKDRNSNIQLHSRLPGSMVGNLPVTILLELSFKVKNKQTNKQTNKPNMCHLLGRFLQIFWRKKNNQRHNTELNISLAMAQHLHFEVPSDVFSRYTGGDEDQKKEPNQVTHTCRIIKIHWIYSTGQNGGWQLGHIASVQMGSGVR